MSRITKGTLILFGFCVITVLVYYNGLHIPYYFDDYEHIYFKPSSEIFGGFFHANAYAHFYRPLERSFLALVQTYWGWDTFPIRITHLFLHLVGAYFVYYVLRSLKVGIVPSFAGAIFVIVSQLSVYAIASNDSLSQIEGALFSAFSLWLLYKYLEDKHQGSFRYTLSVLLFFLALISKETSAGLLLGIPVVIFFTENDRGKLRQNFHQIFNLFNPYLICFVIYYALRTVAGGSVPTLGNAGYTFHFGFNIFSNAGLFLAQAITPFSSLSIARSAFYHEYIRLAALLGFTGIFAFMIGIGLWKSTRRNIIICLFILIFCSWIPVLFLNATNELYPYNMIFYLGALFGIAVEYYLSALPEYSRFLRNAIVIVLTASLISNALGTNEKTSAMKILGERADALLPQIISVAKTMPQNSLLCLVNPKESKFEYSQFVMKGFRVISGCNNIVNYYANRSDLQYDICDSADAVQEINNRSGVAFTFDISTLQFQRWRP